MSTIDNVEIAFDARMRHLIGNDLRELTISLLTFLYMRSASNETFTTTVYRIPRNEVHVTSILSARSFCDKYLYQTIFIDRSRHMLLSYAINTKESVQPSISLPE